MSYCIALTGLEIYVDQANLKLRDLPASASRVLESKVCATTAWLGSPRSSQGSRSTEQVKRDGVHIECGLGRRAEHFPVPLGKLAFLS